MEFPMLNISFKDWNNEDDLTIFLLFDNIIYNDNDVFFDKYFKNHLFCDCEGRIYKITKKIPPQSAWRRALKFLPNTYKIELQLRPTHETYSIAQLKGVLLERLRGIREQNNFTKEWIAIIEKMQTYEGVISGEE